MTWVMIGLAVVGIVFAGLAQAYARQFIRRRDELVAEFLMAYVNEEYREMANIREELSSMGYSISLQSRDEDD